MKKLNRLLSLAVLAALPALVSAQSVWTNAGGDFAFSNPSNWSGNAVPVDGADLRIATDDLLGLDNGGNFAANSLAIEAGYTGLFLPASAETLSVGAGGITNLGLGADFQLTLLAVSTQTWDIGGGTVTLGGTFDVTDGTALTVNLGNGATFLFSMSALNPDWSGTVNFTGSVGVATIRASGAGFTAQNLSRITINGVEAELLGDELIAAAAIPEPSTYAMLAGVAALLIAARRRCTQRAVAH